MIWRCLPPAGEPIDPRGRAAELPVFPGYRSLWVNSGTAALALALSLAWRRHPGIRTPEVVLPGYACPDLVAAAVHAGLQPVLVDIGADDPGFDLEALRAAISPNTVAVVAVNFLGIRERLTEIRELLRAWPVVSLIEDDAQWFPEGKGPVLSGDAVCISFGRGKPVSLLGGGALFVHESWAAFDSFVPKDLHFAASGGYLLPSKIRAYNLLLRPVFYGFLARNPLLSLGRTVYKPLRGIASMDVNRGRLLPVNIAHHLNRRMDIAAKVREAVPNSMSLPVRLKERAGRLLRYPVLCEDRRQRDSLLSLLDRSGLGGSAMYERPLPDIDNVRERVTVCGDLRSARQFADRLLTLPVHSGVGDGDILQMRRLFSH
jgi:dTDP-4-amino-4,6-dideoxygalactose transaminase